jgi:hypothetical protein
MRWTRGPNIEGRFSVGGLEPRPRPRAGWSASRSRPQPRHLQRTIRDRHRRRHDQPGTSSGIPTDARKPRHGVEQTLLGQDQRDPHALCRSAGQASRASLRGGTRPGTRRPQRNYRLTPPSRNPLQVCSKHRRREPTRSLRGGRSHVRVWPRRRSSTPGCRLQSSPAAPGRPVRSWRSSPAGPCRRRESVP